MLSDIEIAQNAEMYPIGKIAAELSIAEEDIEYYGHYKAKLSEQLFQKLDSGVGVGFDWCRWEMMFPAKFPVVVQHAVVGEGKRLFAAVSLERVVVTVPLLAALGGESGVPDDRSRVPGKEQLDLVCRFRLFVSNDAAIPDVGDACCVCATDFRSDREIVYQLFQNGIANLTFVI